MTAFSRFVADMGQPVPASVAALIFSRGRSFDDQRSKKGRSYLSFESFCRAVRVLLNYTMLSPAQRRTGCSLTNSEFEAAVESTIIVEDGNATSARAKQMGAVDPDKDKVDNAKVFQCHSTRTKYNH